MTIDIDRAEIIATHIDHIKARMECIGSQFVHLAHSRRALISMTEYERIAREMETMAGIARQHIEAWKRDAERTVEAEARVAALVGRKEAA